MSEGTFCECCVESSTVVHNGIRSSCHSANKRFCRVFIVLFFPSTKNTLKRASQELYSCWCSLSVRFHSQGRWAPWVKNLVIGTLPSDMLEEGGGNAVYFLWAKLTNSLQTNHNNTFGGRQNPQSKSPSGH